jgi:hypothetical protein
MQLRDADFKRSMHRLAICEFWMTREPARPAPLALRDVSG